jgi:transposase
MSAGRAARGPGESASQEDSPPARPATTTTTGEATPMAKEQRPRADRPAPKPRPGEIAQAQGRTLNSYRLGALPMLEAILQRLRLEEFLGERLPAEDPRTKIATATGLLLLIKNLLVSREPLYGVGEWAARFVPRWLGLAADELVHLNDDRVGRCLDRLFDADIASLTLSVVTHAVREFDVELDELHNDSTTVTFHGAYEEAAEETTRRGKPAPAITWGHNKDHRPDLKQLLFILTVARDGAVPVQFRVASGNVADDGTHRDTWDLLCKLTGRRDFLYVADCKLASAENMAHVHQRGGRFLSVLPRTRGEDATFRGSLQRGEVTKRPIYDKTDEDGEVLDRYSLCEPAALSAEGYRLIWFHSTSKAEHDADARYQQVARTTVRLSELREKLASPRTRYRQRAKVEDAVAEILRELGTAKWFTITIEERELGTFRQEGRGRPTERTRYVREAKTVFEVKHRVEFERLVAEMEGDGFFPLITNELSASERDLLLAYKGQPALERRFAQLKTDFEVAPVYLKEVSRIGALLCVYFFVLLVEALLERELRRAMARCELASLPLYPEGRACRRPTARRVIDLFEELQCHELSGADQPPVRFTTELTPLQRKVLRLLGMPKAYDG